MLKKEADDYQKFLDIAKHEAVEILNNLDAKQLENAANLIRRAVVNGNRLHVSGIGKPSHIAGYAASLFSSTGTPAYYLHGTEAVHGSCGQLVPGDVVIFISNSGETAEMRATVTAIKNNDCPVIGICRSSTSWLAKKSDICIIAGICQEGGPLNRAPRMSIIAELFALQALSILLQSEKEITPQQYVKWHPGGMLGSLREEELNN